MRRVLLAAALVLAAACADGGQVFDPAASTWQAMATWEGTDDFVSPQFDPGVAEWRVTLTTSAGSCAHRPLCRADVNVGRVHPSGVRTWTNLGGIWGSGTVTANYSDGALPHVLSVAARDVNWRVTVEAR